ncbi:hypothetical protein ASPVEDRAFT_855667 [Aspergillus versicolor CBS 583.65]|uniref:Uncharacterized protein n=1 Tax=Aspergillus versicolor CBS 583.65 TaxID=1036611 RepID=A0A1L9PVP7_ASPVE|nr:uncharacterized protein ASPVEDRAFT_855667 [Aspergillus versicolor CBS 583.65]OJJ05496.1 hypothetical protein ASPVEDRAFT_855667 [Aspergillus versicolor CBS 583.65]
MAAALCRYPWAQFLPVNDYPKAENRPEVERTTKTTFTAQSDYTTMLGHTTIFEQELHTQMVGPLEDPNIPLVTITILHVMIGAFLGSSSFYFGDRIQEDARRD